MYNFENRIGLYSRQQVSQSEYAQIIELMEVCNKHDTIDLSVNLNLSILIDRTGDEESDLLYYENNKLVGYVGIYSFFKKDEVEICGMVHPDFRRRGIFTRLFEAAKSECKERWIKTILLVNEQKSESGKAFAVSVKASHEFSEYRMKYDITTVKELPKEDSCLTLRIAEGVDTPDLIDIGMKCFNTSLEEEKSLIVSGMLSKHRRIFTALFNDIIIGTITVSTDGLSSNISGFAVHPDFQGRGFGKQILLNIVNNLLNENVCDINIEVETKNQNALRLYEGCSFKVTTAYDYYKISL